MKSLLERFNEKFIPEPNSGCWLWTAALTGRRYGGIGAGPFCKIRRAHCVSWELHRGKIPKGLHVLHECDTPTCVNPDHLFLGTHADNMRDMKEKNRADRVKKRGAANGRAKLIEADVLVIRKSKIHETELAKRYGVSRQAIRLVLQRKNWAHVP